MHQTMRKIDEIRMTHLILGMISKGNKQMVSERRRKRVGDKKYSFDQILLSILDILFELVHDQRSSLESKVPTK